MKESVVVEFVRFRLATGTDDENFIANFDRMHDEFIKKQDGYLHRQLLKGDDGTWIDFVHWKSLQDEQHANELMMDEPSAVEFIQSIDLDSIETQHFELVKSWDE